MSGKELRKCVQSGDLWSSISNLSILNRHRRTGVPLPLHPLMTPSVTTMSRNDSKGSLFGAGTMAIDLGVLPREMKSTKSKPSWFYCCFGGREGGNSGARGMHTHACTYDSQGGVVGGGVGHGVVDLQSLGSSGGVSSNLDVDLGDDGGSGGRGGRSGLGSPLVMFLQPIRKPLQNSSGGGGGGRGLGTLGGEDHSHMFSEPDHMSGLEFESAL